MIASDEQAFKAMAEKFPEKFRFFSRKGSSVFGIHMRERGPNAYIVSDGGGLYSSDLTSDDYQALAGELGYVIEPEWINEGWITIVWHRVAYRHSDDPGPFPTMLSAMQHGFWKVVELATEEK